MYTCTVTEWMTWCIHFKCLRLIERIQRVESYWNEQIRKETLDHQMMRIKDSWNMIRDMFKAIMSVEERDERERTKE